MGLNTYMETYKSFQSVLLMKKDMNNMKGRVNLKKAGLCSAP